MTLLKKILFYFWLTFYYIKNLPTLLVLIINREYLYFKIFLNELFKDKY